MNMSQIDKYFSEFQSVLYRRKERIIRPINDVTDIFYIKQGYVRQYIISKDGVELTTYIFSSGSIFPLLPIVTSAKNTYYYESLNPVELKTTSREAFNIFLKKNPEEYREILTQLSFYASNLARKFESRVFDDAHNRVIFILLDLAKQFGEISSEEVTIRYWFTQQDIALMTGLSRERVTFQINKLIKLKLISYNRHFIVITNMSKLAKEIN